jgi:hypothetical protein
LRSRETSGRFWSILAYGVNGGSGPLIIWYACSRALEEEDPAITIWSWLCVLSIGVFVALLARKMDTKSFAVVSSVMWLGLFVIWFLYENVQDEDGRLAARLISPSCVIVIAASVAVLHNCQSNSTLVEYKPLVADGASETELVTVEKGSVKRGNDSAARRKEGEPVPNIRMSSIAMEHGRPLLRDLFTSVEGAKCVGVFTCGPSRLMQDVLHTVQLLESRNYFTMSPCFPIYEESVEVDR